MDRHTIEGVRPGSGAAAPAQEVRILEKVLPLRIVIVDPPVGVMFCVQQGDAEVVSPVQAAGSPISFEVPVLVRDTDAFEGPRLMGPFVKGPSNARFVYVNSGTLAGQPDSRWTRRAKIPLTGITAALIARALASPGARLEARIGGTAADGGPACATVTLLGRGWEAKGMARPTGSDGGSRRSRSPERQRSRR